MERKNRIIKSGEDESLKRSNNQESGIPKVYQYFHPEIPKVHPIFHPEMPNFSSKEYISKEKDQEKNQTNNEITLKNMGLWPM